MTTVDHATAGLAEHPPIPFGRLLRAEARKSTDPRSARVLLVVIGLILIGAAVVPVYAADDGAVQSHSDYLMPTSLALGLFLPVVLILLVSTEWTQRTMLWTLVQEPRRARVLTAKVVLGLALIVLGGCAALVLTAGGLTVAGMLGHDTVWDVSASDGASFVVGLGLSGLLAMAFAALFQHTAAAITAYVFLPMVVNLVTIPAPSAREWIDTNETFNRLVEGSWSGHVPQILVAAALWIVLPGVLGVVRTLRRDIS